MDQNTKTLVKRHPLLRNAPLLGRGSFCYVFQGKKKTSVLKLTTDPTHVAYLTDSDAPHGVYKPKVFANHRVIGETSAGRDLFLLEVERLQPIDDGSANWDLADTLIVHHFNNDWLPQSKRSARWASEDLLCFMRELNRFTRIFECRLDLSTANFMERSNRQLVFNDPVMPLRKR